MLYDMREEGLSSETRHAQNYPTLLYTMKYIQCK